MSEKDVQDVHEDAYKDKDERRYSTGMAGRRRSTVAELNTGSMLLYHKYTVDNTDRALQGISTQSPQQQCSTRSLTN